MIQQPWDFNIHVKKEDYEKEGFPFAAGRHFGHR